MSQRPMLAARRRSARRSPCSFVPATAADVPFLDALRRRDATALGFLSRTAIAEKVRLGQTRVAVVNGRPAGFVIHGSLRGAEVRVFQLAVDPASRGRGVGRALVADLLRTARRAGAAGVSLRCRERLAANRFWHAAGFRLHDLEPARSGALFVWVRPVGGVAAFRFHTRWHRCPACRRWTCGSWTLGAVRRRACGECTSAVAQASGCSVHITGAATRDRRAGARRSRVGGS